MIAKIQLPEPPNPIDVPVRIDADGTMRIGETRVPLQTIIYAFRQGDSPEQMVDSFPVLTLADVYAVIAYYLRERDMVEVYVQRQEAIADEVRRENEARFPTEGLRARLLARMEEKRKLQG